MTTPEVRDRMTVGPRFKNLTMQAIRTFVGVLVALTASVDAQDW